MEFAKEATKKEKEDFEKRFDCEELKENLKKEVLKNRMMKEQLRLILKEINQIIKGELK